MASPTLVLELPTGVQRIPLERPVLRLGGGAADVPVDGVGDAQLHVWSDPPKAVRVGGGPELVVDGKRTDEALIEANGVAVWGPLQLRVEGLGSVLEEIADEPQGSASSGGRPTVGGGLDEVERRAWDRLKAGLLVELGLGNGKAAKRWQSAVVQGEWDADACARDILEGAGDATQDPRFVERAGRLQRDLVMASFHRGMRKAGRSARRAAKQGSAFLLANFIAFLCYTAIIVAIAVLVRVKWGVAWDGMIDRAIGVFR